MNAVLKIVDDHPRRLTPEQYRAERDTIQQTYGDSSKEAGALRDQALADLYHRSGWTQDELAKVEGCSRVMIVRRTLFGRFLAFVPDRNIPKNLAEFRFRGYWARTEKEPNERIRFQAVLRLIEEETRIGKSHANKLAIGNAIMAKYADGAWHKLSTIVAHVDAEADDIKSVLSTMQQKGTYSSHCERKQVGTSHSYRIVRKSGKAVDVDVLTKELEPILEGLKAEGQKNMATMSPGTVAYLAHQLEKLVEKLAK